MSSQILTVAAAFVIVRVANPPADGEGHQPLPGLTTESIEGEAAMCEESMRERVRAVWQVGRQAYRGQSRKDGVTPCHEHPLAACRGTLGPGEVINTLYILAAKGYAETVGGATPDRVTVDQTLIAAAWRNPGWN